MDRLTLELLGGFQGTLWGRPLPQLRTRKVAALLIYLVTEDARHYRKGISVYPRLHERQSLMTLLWPERSAQSARRNLRQILYHLRHAFERVPGRRDEEAVPLVEADREAVWLNPDAALDSDVARFMQLLRGETGGECLASLPRDTSACRERLQAAADLYQGDFLKGVDLVDAQTFQEWVLLMQEYLRQQALVVLEGLTALCLHIGDVVCAEGAARQQIRIDDLRESAYRQLMEVLARSGHRTQALKLYDELCRRLRDDLGIIPEAATRHLHQAVLAESIA